MNKLYTLLLFIFTIFTANAQIITIPDANFKAKLLLASPSNTIATNASNVNLKIDTNNNNEIEVSEALQVVRLDVNGSGISNLTGIAGFANLTTLDCGNNQLATLNLSGLNFLSYLECSYNQITSIDLNGLNNLTSFNCSFNQLTILNFSGLNSLLELTCAYNQITSLDFTNLNLQHIQCHYNLLTVLDVSNMSNLIFLFCGDNQISSLNLNGLTNLFELDAARNLLTTINLESLTALEDINLDVNLLTSIDLRSLPNVANVDIVGNHLTEILCKNGHNENLVFLLNPNLNYICADDSQITSLQNQAASYGYTNCTVNASCSILNENFYVETSFSVSPNPVNQILNLEINANIGITSIIIYNLLGQIVIGIPNAESVSTIDVSDLKTGTYFIKVNTDKGTANTKFLKN